MFSVIEAFFQVRTEFHLRKFGSMSGAMNIRAVHVEFPIGNALANLSSNETIIFSPQGELSMCKQRLPSTKFI
ncbi:hypothetical protein GUITHDRAFT_154848, partial [Guillardia theta CCMP2712]